MQGKGQFIGFTLIACSALRHRLWHAKKWGILRQAAAGVSSQGNSQFCSRSQGFASIINLARTKGAFYALLPNRASTSHLSDIPWNSLAFWSVSSPVLYLISCPSHLPKAHPQSHLNVKDDFAMTCNETVVWHADINMSPCSQGY